MSHAATPSENARLAHLALFHPRDLTALPGLDRLTKLATDLFGTSMALVSLLDDDRQWLKSRCGLNETDTAREHAFCAHLLPLGPGGLLVVEDASADPRFAANPLVTGEPGIRFYAGAALTSHDGHVLGSFCVLDTQPRRAPDTQMLERLQTLAGAAADQLELERAIRQQLQQKRLLELAETVSGVGHWRLDLATKHVNWSHEVYAIHGVSPHDFDPNLDSAIDFYHPEDQPKVRASLDAAVASELPVGFQLRLRRNDGDQRTVVSRSLCQRDSNGQPVAVFGVFQDITVHTRALVRAQREEARYRLLADNMADVVTRIRLDGSSGYISPTIERVLGYRPEEMAGRPAQDFVHPDDRAEVLSAFAALAAGEARRTIEVRAVRKDGTQCWVETSFQSVADDTGTREIVAVIRDVTERRALQEAAQERERLYQLIADHSTDMIDRSNLDCEILYASPAALELTGCSPEELVGRKTTEFIHPEDWPHVQRAYAKLVHFGHQARVEPITYRMLRKDGSQAWVEVSPKLVWNGDQPVEFVDVVRDITARKAAEAELVEARHAAEAAATAKAQFLANMSHELRTPLTSIIGFGKLLAEHLGLDPVAQRCVAQVELASHQLLHTVNDVLDISKLEAGQLPIVPSPTAVVAFCTATLDLLAPQAAAKDVALVLDIDEDVPPILFIDPDRVRQMLLNLLGNAVKFTSHGSVILKVRHAGAEPGNVSMTVVDTGPGIAPHLLPLLFQRFSQVDGGLDRTHGGAGLGLAICKGLAEAMGGEVGVSSQPDCGSQFWFRIPAPATNRLQDSTPAHDPERDPTGLRVLLVEDHPVNRELACVILRAAGCDVVEAEDGNRALEIAAETPFDVVLMDLQMPGRSGRNTLRALRSCGGPNDAVPVLAFTADVTAGMDALQADGFAGIVPKPVQPAQLIQALTAAVEEPTYAAVA